MAYTLNKLEEKLKNSREARDIIKSMINYGKLAEKKPWRGFFAVPAGCLIEPILNAFYKETDIPLELPFFAFLYFLSGYLVDKKVKIVGNVGEFYPDIWTIVLAPSGSGKTLTHNIIQKHAPAKSNFNEPAGSAAFIQELSNNNPARWFQDEIGQVLKQIEAVNGPMSEVKKYLLLAYGNATLQRKTKKDNITVEEPVFSILGLNVLESFLKSLSTESLIDGFAQRFAFVVAEKDPNRPITDFPLYNVKKLQNIVETSFSKLSNVEVHSEYVLNESAETAFKDSFKMLHREDIPESFYRRIMFLAFKYAMLYHIILCKNSIELDAEDIGWGARLVSMHIDDIYKILGQSNRSKTIDVISRVFDYIEKRKRDGKETTARDIQINVNAVQSAEQAKIYLAMFQDYAVSEAKPVQSKATTSTSRNEVDEAFGWIDDELNNCLT